jgi:hypothetical protein
MKKLVVFATFVALLFSATAFVWGQGSAESSVRGNLAGVVVDNSGAVVPGAKITLNGPTGTRGVNSNPQGQFQFPLLTPGYYSIKVEKQGFKSADVKSLEVVTNKTSNIRVGMVPGEATTVVEVSANAIQVDTSSTAVSSNLTDTFYSQVPVPRGVTSLFYAAPGVTGGGGTGAANPSISGGTGLENNYIADGVSITDGGFGGIGVYSRVYGSLSTGINLSFVKEVQVKTGGFEAQYGKSTGGIVQIVTKSGGNEFHGSIGGYFAPSQLESDRKHPDDVGRFNLQGKTIHQGNFDADAEIGGYVPGMKNHVFFFGSFNPSWNRNYDQYAQFKNGSDLGTAGLGSTAPVSLGNVDLRNVVYNYAGKLTFKLNQNNQVEASIFGDPTRTNVAPNFILSTSNLTTGDKLDFGTRNAVIRLNSALTPSWLANFSATWGHNGLQDIPSNPDVYSVSDLTQRTPCSLPGGTPNASCVSPTQPLRGQFQRQGLGSGFLEDTVGNNWGFNLDTSKTFNALGQHSATIGYRFDYDTYDGTRFRSGPRFDPLDPSTATSTGVPAGATTDGAFQLRAILGAPCSFACMFIPGYATPVDVFLLQTRGEFGNPHFKTTNRYHTLFAQDTWSLNKYLSINGGLRWEQQQILGTTLKYTFTDNWSPRVGISVDPWGNRRTKIFANYGRYMEAIPLDMAIRSLSNELDDIGAQWIPATDGSLGPCFVGGAGVPISCGNVLVNPDGSLVPAFDAAHLLAPAGQISQQSTTGIAHGTKMQYLDEYVLGFEHDFGAGVIFTARYTDRRIHRIVEDMAAVTPEAAQGGITQQYLIGNPSKKLDIFTNVNELTFNSAAVPPTGCNPAATFIGPGSFGTGVPPYDSNGNGVVLPNGDDSFCVTNSDLSLTTGAGAQIADGIPDGFVDPVRIYKSMEFEVNKSFAKNFQMRANYRIAKLFGNYEGTFRNDNAQSDPNISSLFDFTQGQFNLLGQQFTPGVLNTDVRHLANGFFSYTFPNRAKGLTLGTSVHYQTGVPINNLFAHPVYLNAGEIPFCADNTTTCTSARGSLGYTQAFGSVDLHADYPIRITERSRVRVGADLFNITNNQRLLRVDQNAQRTVGVPNADFSKPNGDGTSLQPAFQRPFYARFMVRYEF